MKSIARVSAMLLIVGALLFGQETSQQIAGSVHDASGAVIPSAKIILRQIATNTAREVNTNEAGYFVITNVPIGDYELDAEASGFERYVQHGLKVNVDQKVSADITMTIGSTSDTVTVKADAAIIETSNGEIGRTISGEQVGQLQLNGRTYTQLLQIIPGVSTNIKDNFSLASGYGAAVNQESINGGRMGYLSVYLDGSDNLATGGGGHSFVNIDPDAIAEVNVLTSNYSAEYGQNAGAVMNAVIKSGTTGFHGEAYEYLRNDVLDARAWNSVSKQKLTYNNFGWNLGGPLYIPKVLDGLRDKLFFFTDMNWRRLRQGNPQIWEVPSALERGGNFSALPVSRQPIDPTTGEAFQGGIIPASMISPNSLRLINNYPLPNFQGSGGNYAFNYNYPMDVDEYVVKLDYNLSDKHHFSFGRVHDDYNSVENQTTLATYQRQIPGTNQFARWTYIINPTTTNSFQFSLPGHHIKQGNYAPNPLFISDYTRQAQGVNYPLLFNASNAIPSLNISGYTRLNVTPLTWNNSDRIIFFKNDFAKVLGQHTVKVGFFAQRNRKSQNNQGAINGSVSFNGSGENSSGNALADALLGNFYNYNEAALSPEGQFRFTQIEWYATDNWKVNSRLSLDLGVRFNYLPQQYVAWQNGVFFSPAYFNPADAPQINPLNGQLIAGTGDPDNGLYVGGSHYPSALSQRVPDLNSPIYQRLLRGAPLTISPTHWPIGPRVGFAYDLTGRGKTVVRGGYGMFFEREQGNFIFSQVDNPPFVQQATIFTGNIDNPTGGIQAHFPPSLTSFDSNVKIPTIQNYSLGIQHKLGTDTLIDVAYVGSSAWNLYRNLNLNQLRSGTLQAHPGVNVNALRPYPGYSDITQYTTGSNSNYNALQIQVRKQFNGGGLINAAYTWSKSIDTLSGFSSRPMDSYNVRGDRGLSDFDRRHMFVLTYVYPLPFWQSQNKWYQKAFGGWQLSGITTIQTGLPLNLSIPVDQAGTGVGGQRPSVVSDWQVSNQNASEWFNGNAFALPAAGTFGSLGRNVVVGPGLDSWDVSAQKSFAVTEQVKLQFRAEMFNAPNHVSFYSVGTQLGASNFGQVTSAYPPRTFQLALKLAF